MGGSPGGDSEGASAEITSWAEEYFTEVTVGDTTLYGLTTPADLSSLSGA